MQLYHLRYFISLSIYKSITKTSLVLNTTPQNLSRILKNLEETMNTDLFIRTSGGIKLTSDGEQFLKFAQSTVFQFDSMRTSIQFKKSNQKSHQEVTLYSTNVVNEIILNYILASFSLIYPSINVNNVIIDWKTGYEQLTRNPSAIGFLYYIPEINDLNQFTITPAFRSHPTAIMSKSHPLASNTMLPLQKIIEHKIINLTQQSFADTELFFFLNQHHLLECCSIINTSNLNACYKIAANTDFICIGSSESFFRQSAELRQNLVAIPLIEPCNSDFIVIHSDSLPIDSPQQLLRTFILNYLQEHPI